MFIYQDFHKIDEVIFSIKKREKKNKTKSDLNVFYYYALPSQGIFYYYSFVLSFFFAFILALIDNF